MNTVCLVGRLTADPELKTTPSGTNVCAFSVAINRQFANKDGTRDADFINCVAWRQTGEFISRYFNKGDMIGLNGSIQTRTYQDKDTGKNRTAFEVIINNAHFVESKKDKTGFEPAKAVQPTPSNTDDFSTIESTEGDLPF